MSDAIPVHCRHCNEPLDVYQPFEERFCSVECKADGILTDPAELEYVPDHVFPWK